MMKMKMTSGEASSGMMAGTPPKKKNAASQWSKRKRVSHPLLETEEECAAPSTSPSSSSTPTPRKSSAGRATGKVLFEYNTPPRHFDPSVVTPALTTCSPDSPALVDALQMAARPSPSRSSDIAESPQTSSYSSSIEAMAAYVEASRVSELRNIHKMHNTKHKRGDGSDTSTSSSSIVGNTNNSKQSSSSYSINKPRSRSSTNTVLPVHNPKRSAWIASITIMVMFLLSEVFLGILVFCFKDSVDAVAVGDVVPPDDVQSIPDIVQLPKFAFGNIAPLSFDHHDLVRDKVVNQADENEEVVVDSADDAVLGVGGRSDADNDRGYTIVNEGNSGGEIVDNNNIEQFEEFKKLQSMLEDGFDGLRASIFRKGAESNTRKSVESTCGHVWVLANEYMSNNGRASSSSSNDDRTSIDAMVPISWESLALDAQHCLGGAGLAFLDKNDLDMERLRLSTQVFDRLSTVRPFDPDVRAGLGTCLLIQGIFHQDDKSTKTSNNAKSPVQSSLLSLATYHLKVASSLSSSPQSVLATTTSGSGRADIISRYGVTKSDDDNAASHAAILHNLALAYLAVGDTDSSVLFLLRAAAIRREQHSRSSSTSSSSTNDTKPYWNAPDDVLQAAEVEALLVAAKPNWSLPEKPKGKRTPFLPYRITNSLE